MKITLPIFNLFQKTYLKPSFKAKQGSSYNDKEDDSYSSEKFYRQNFNEKIDFKNDREEQHKIDVETGLELRKIDKELQSLEEISEQTPSILNRINELKQQQISLKTSMIKRHWEFIKLKAREFNWQNDIDSAISSSYIGFLTALDKYNPADNSEIPFISFAKDWMEQRLRRDINQNTQVTVPIARKLKLSQIQNFITKFNTENGRIPNHEEIAEALGLSIKTIKDILLHANLQTTSLNSMIGSDEDTDYAYFIEDEKANKEFERKMDEEDIVYMREIIKKLPEKKRIILSLRYRLDDPNTDKGMRTLEEISIVTKLTRERVRQIIEDSIKDIRRIMLKKGKISQPELQSDSQVQKSRTPINQTESNTPPQIKMKDYLLIDAFMTSAEQFVDTPRAKEKLKDKLTKLKTNEFSIAINTILNKDEKKVFIAKYLVKNNPNRTIKTTHQLYQELNMWHTTITNNENNAIKNIILYIKYGKDMKYHMLREDIINTTRDIKKQKDLRHVLNSTTAPKLKNIISNICSEKQALILNELYKLDKYTPYGIRKRELIELERADEKKFKDASYFHKSGLERLADYLVSAEHKLVSGKNNGIGNIFILDEFIKNLTNGIKDNNEKAKISEEIKSYNAEDFTKILNTMLSDKRKEVILGRYSVEKNPSKKVPSLAELRKKLNISEAAISFREKEAFNNILMFLKFKDELNFEYLKNDLYENIKDENLLKEIKERVEKLSNQELLNIIKNICSELETRRISLIYKIGEDNKFGMQVRALAEVAKIENSNPKFIRVTKATVIRKLKHYFVSPENNSNLSNFITFLTKHVKDDNTKHLIKEKLSAMSQEMLIATLKKVLTKEEYSVIVTRYNLNDMLGAKKDKETKDNIANQMNLKTRSNVSYYERTAVEKILNYLSKEEKANISLLIDDLLSRANEDEKIAVKKKTTKLTIKKLKKILSEILDNDEYRIILSRYYLDSDAVERYPKSRLITAKELGIKDERVVRSLNYSAIDKINNYLINGFKSNIDVFKDALLENISKQEEKDKIKIEFEKLSLDALKKLMKNHLTEIGYITLTERFNLDDFYEQAKPLQSLKEIAIKYNRTNLNICSIKKNAIDKAAVGYYILVDGRENNFPGGISLPGIINCNCRNDSTVSVYFCGLSA